MLEQHTTELLKLHGKGDDHTFTGNGKVVKENNARESSRGNNRIDPGLIAAITDILANHTINTLQSTSENASQS